MKKSFLILVLAVSTAMVFNACSSKSTKTEQSAKTYVCPMPKDSVTSDKPGTCPKCGMDLVEKEANSK